MTKSSLIKHITAMRKHSRNGLAVAEIDESIVYANEYGWAFALDCVCPWQRTPVPWEHTTDEQWAFFLRGVWRPDAPIGLIALALEAE